MHEYARLFSNHLQKASTNYLNLFYIKYMFYYLNLLLYKIYVLAVLYLDFAINKTYQKFLSPWHLSWKACLITFVALQKIPLVSLLTGFYCIPPHVAVARLLYLPQLEISILCNLCAKMNQKHSITMTVGE